MQFGKICMFALCAVFVTTTLVFAGPGAHLSLINATPYEWRITYTHHYRMDWKPSKSVAPGKSVQDYHEFLSNHRDEAAEATYELIGHPEKATFTVQARNIGEKRIEVQYGPGLRSLNNVENSLINLHWQHNGVVTFILSGSGIDTPFISSNPPVSWMQATLPTIGSKSLREISMPASHDAGMSELTKSYTGVPHNTLTQSGTIYQQLVNGARYFDLRPAVRQGRWYTHHLTIKSIIGTIGGLGRSITNIIDDVNKFTEAHPGELIILELSHDVDADRKWQAPTSPQWQVLYMQLLQIKDLWLAPINLPEDISTVPISTFIQPGSKSAVIVRFPNGAPPPVFGDVRARDIDLNSTTTLDSTTTVNDDAKQDGNDSTKVAAEVATVTTLSEAVPQTSPTTLPELPQPPKPVFVPVQDSSIAKIRGFFPERRLPQTGAYSDTDNERRLSKDQLAKVAELRPVPDAEPLRSTWTITQKAGHVIDVANRGHSIIGLAAWGHRALFRDLWKSMTLQSYPNLVEVDDIWSSQFAALCMAMNDHFANDKSNNGKPEKVTGRRRRRG